MTKKIGFADVTRKMDACIAELDPIKTCGMCKYKDVSKDDTPCSDCHVTVLGFPINPTKWEAPNV